MTSLTSSSFRRRVGVLSGAVCAASLCLLGSAGTATAVEFGHEATLDVQTSCVEGTFHLDIVMDNLAGLDTAQFIASLFTGNTGWNAIAFDVSAGETFESHLTAVEGTLVTVHITSGDAIPPINYTLEVIADCIEDTTIPETTVAETVVVETTAVGSGGSRGGGLPSTGSSNWLLTGVAAALLLAGITLTRSTRRA